MTKHPLETQLQQYIALSRYARWLPEENRRETWEETVRRYVNFWFEDRKLIDQETADLIFDYIYNIKAMPSMRCLMTAGPALNTDEMAAFNCSYIALGGSGTDVEVSHDLLDEPVKIHLCSPIDFDEILYVLMCGTGVGFSVERQFVSRLPKVGKKLNRRIYQPTHKNYPGVPLEEISRFDSKNNVIRVHDSKYGWASALRILVVELYNGNFNVGRDVSGVRPAGARLKTFGGRSSGPDPLVALFEFAINLFKKANGRKLTSFECHSLVCMIADIVVVGGVRRSALISLSNLSDERMRGAKSGAWWEENSHFRLANNSACYTERPDIGVFMKEWQSLYESKSGERGIFNREAAQNLIPQRRKDLDYKDYGCNPCSEILLRSKSTCNLSEVVVRSTDSLEDLIYKVQVATILGTLQSTLTNFRYVSKEWKENCDLERLLGVSLTGVDDHYVLSGQAGKEELINWLQRLKAEAIFTNFDWAAKLGINQSAAITCVKPSGCTSLQTEIKTTEGVVSMAELFAINDYSDSYISSLEPQTWLDLERDIYVFDENNDPQKITKLYVNGAQPVFEIAFEDGQTYKFTGNHKLKTTSGWKRVDELTEEDEIVSF